MRVLHLDSGKEMRGGQWQVLSLLKGLGPDNLLLTPEGGPLITRARHAKQVNREAGDSPP